MPPLLPTGCTTLAPVEDPGLVQRTPPKIDVSLFSGEGRGGGCGVRERGGDGTVAVDEGVVADKAVEGVVVALLRLFLAALLTAAVAGCSALCISAPPPPCAPAPAAPTAVVIVSAGINRIG